MTKTTIVGRTEAQLVEDHEKERLAFAAAKAAREKLQEIRPTLLRSGTLDEVLELDEQISREGIKAEIAKARMEPLKFDLEMVRRERARWLGVDMPTDGELARLMAIVAEAHPWLSFPPTNDNSYISRHHKAEFKCAFYGVGRMLRLSEPTQKIEFHTHVDRINNLLRGHGHSEVEGDAVMAAIIAWNDVFWRKADRNLGQLLEVALDRYSGLPCSSEGWRGLLKGEPVRPPLPPRGFRAPPSRPTPQVSIYQQDPVTGQMSRVEHLAGGCERDLSAG